MGTIVLIFLKIQIFVCFLSPDNVTLVRHHGVKTVMEKNLPQAF